MVSGKAKCLQTHANVSLEDLVPSENLYHQSETKQWHHLAYFRLRGLPKVNIEALLITSGQNVKRL